VTANHPDQDTLADLAADVLPSDLARAVESHVMGCAHCGALLDSAERVRTLLLSADPGPMPDQLWARLEQALLAEAAAGPGTGVQGRASGNTTGIMRRAPSGQTGLQEAVAGGPAERSGERTQVLHRPGRIPQPTRRQTRRNDRGPERTDAPSRGARMPMVLVAAAALIAVATVSTLLVRNMHNNADPGTTAAADLSEAKEREAVVSLTRTSASGTNYTAPQLNQQVNALIGKPPKALSAQPQAPGDAKAGAGVGGGVSGNAALADRKALAECLTALDVPAGTRPLAVDLGSFEGQEAAIIVLPARERGYEVWAVARTCNKNDDGTIYYQVVKAQ
jgi:hypothetical protein